MDAVLEREEQQIDENDDDKVAHYAESAAVTEAYVTGKPIIALCGAIFVPSRDPEKLPVCSICKEIMDALFLVDN